MQHINNWKDQSFFLPEDTIKIIVIRETSGYDVRFVIHCIQSNGTYTTQIVYINTVEQALALTSDLLAFGNASEIQEVDRTTSIVEYVPAAH